MKQFSLDEYIANSSMKVVTRDGRAVKIICTDAKGNFPVIGLIADDVTLSHRELKILLIWGIFFAYILIRLARAKYRKVA